MIDIKTIVFNALENIVQPEIAKWLNAFFTVKLGRYYWNDYIVHGYAEYISKEKNSKKWSPSYNGLQDIDISKLWDIVLYFKSNFNNANDEAYGNLYNVKQAIGTLYELRNKTDHNSATNINNLSEDDLYSIVHSLSTINASEESKNKIKNMIEEIRKEISLPVSQKNNKTTDTPKENSEKKEGIITPIGNKVEKVWDRYSARNFCCNHGCQIHKKYFNYASENSVGDVYWVNPSLDWSKHDWHIILDYKDEHCFKILHIPANSFSANNFTIKQNKSGAKVNLVLDKQSLIDRNSQINFQPCLVKTIKY